MPEPDDHQHAGDFPERDDDEQPERCHNTDDIKQDYGNYHAAITSGWPQIWLELWRCTFWQKPSADTRKDGAFTHATLGRQVSEDLEVPPGGCSREGQEYVSFTA